MVEMIGQILTGEFNWRDRGQRNSELEFFGILCCLEIDFDVGFIVVLVVIEDAGIELVAAEGETLWEVCGCDGAHEREI